MDAQTVRPGAFWAGENCLAALPHRPLFPLGAAHVAVPVRGLPPMRKRRANFATKFQKNLRTGRPGEKGDGASDEERSEEMASGAA